MKECVSMIWAEDDNEKNLQMSASPATDLEQEYETSIIHGLAASEANRRLAENPWKYLTKEKKRSWLRSIKQECLDPLFFFLIFLSAFLCMIGETGWQIAVFFLLVVLLLKGRQVMDNYYFLQNRKQLFLPKVQVLRDGKYKYIDVREIVIGDILRLKKGQKVPAAVCSLAQPGVIYEKGIYFPEEAGKVIVAAVSQTTVFPKKNILSRLFAESSHLPLRAQEWLFRQGVIAMENALVPNVKCKGKRIVFLDTEYFPSVRKCHLLREMLQEAKKENLSLIFFTDKKREDVYNILQHLSLVKEERDIINEKEFACYGKEDYEKQKSTIRAYIGLNNKEKKEVVEAWRKDCQWICFLANRNWKCPKGWQSVQADIAKTSVISVGLLHQMDAEREIYFGGHWGEGLFHLLRTASRWHTYEEKTEKVQQMALMALCIFNSVMLLGGICSRTPETFVWMFLLSVIVCGGLAVWKEWWWRWLRQDQN